MSGWKLFRLPAVLPRAPGVYAVYLDGALTYIGQTVDLRNRMSEHDIRHGYAQNIITPWGDAKDVVLKVGTSRKYGDWAMRELRLIRRLRPSGNRRGLGRRKAAA